MVNIIIILAIETATRGDLLEGNREDYGSRYQKIQSRKQLVLILDVIVFGFILVLVVLGIFN